MRAEEIAKKMAAWEVSPEAQLKQTAFRKAVVEAFGIEAGAKALEIGCGQGDTTAVLADAVGKKGSVVAVDRAKPSYGAPVNLGDATAHLAKTPLGKNIEFRLEFDIMKSADAFEADAFDAVVFAHSAWHFSTPDTLRQTLEAVRPWAKRLYLAEWDLDPDSLDQVAHWTAVVLGGQLEASLPEGEANVRTPLSKTDVMALVERAGWKIERDFALDSAGLDDGRWEIEACLARIEREATERKLPPRLRKSLENRAAALREQAEQHGTRSLPSFGLVARRREPGEDEPKKSRFSDREDRAAPKGAKPLFDKTLGRGNFDRPRGPRNGRR